jgi:hypothetical protein
MPSRVAVFDRLVEGIKLIRGIVAVTAPPLRIPPRL